MQSLEMLLRTMIDQIDKSVEQIYTERGSRFKPRFFPIVQVLLHKGPMSIKRLAQETSVSHSAVSQTVSAMKKAGYLVSGPGEDKRERQIEITENLRKELPELLSIWRAISVAAMKLDKETPLSLHKALREGIDALEQKNFYRRIHQELS